MGQTLENTFISKNNDSGRYFIYSMALDDSGNQYTCGLLEGKADFSRDSNAYFLRSNGQFDCFVAKYNSEGKLLWAKSFGGISTDLPSKIAVDKEQNIVLLGTFWYTMQIDPNTPASKVTSNGASDLFVLKLKQNGDFVWIKTIGNDRYDQSYGLDIGTNGDVLIAGNYNFNIDINPEQAVVELQGTQARNSYCIVFDKNGIYKWSKHIQGLKDNHYYAVCFDKLNNVYVAGSFAGQTYLHPETKTDSSNARGSAAALIQKFDQDGSFLWEKIIDGAAAEEITSLAIDPNNELIFSGYFNNSISFAPNDSFICLGTYSAFVAKCNANGALVWNKVFTNNKRVSISALAVDQNYNIWTVGVYNEVCDFNPNKAYYPLENIGYDDGFISKLNYLGEFVGAASLGSVNYEQFTEIKIFNKNIIAVGNVYGTTTLKLGKLSYLLSSQNSQPQVISITLADNLLSNQSQRSNQNIKVFPNPSKGQMFIQAQNIQSIKLYDICGKELDFNIESQDLFGLTLNTQKLIPGIYLLTIQTDSNNSIQVKICIENP